MKNPWDGAEFFYNPNVEQFVIHDLHDVQFIGGGLCEIIPVTYHKVGGVWIGTHKHTCVAPVPALARMAGLVLRKAGLAAFDTSFEAATRVLGMH